MFKFFLSFFRGRGESEGEGLIRCSINRYIYIHIYLSYPSDTISRLNSYGDDNKRVEIKKALEMAKTILHDLKNVNLPKKTLKIEELIK